MTCIGLVRLQSAGLHLCGWTKPLFWMQFFRENVAFVCSFCFNVFVAVLFQSLPPLGTPPPP